VRVFFLLVKVKKLLSWIAKVNKESKHHEQREKVKNKKVSEKRAVFLCISILY